MKLEKRKGLSPTARSKFFTQLKTRNVGGAGMYETKKVKMMDTQELFSIYSEMKKEG